MAQTQQLSSSLAHGIMTIDCQYLYPEFAAAYLVKQGSRAMFVETNTTHAVPKLLNALHQTGLTPEQVEYIVITHVHLDHAGGAGALMAHCPNATLLAHPRAATHAIDPSRLVASARVVYGNEAFDRLYGEIKPIDASRVRALEDGAEVRLGDRPFRFFHTRGHANHHFCIQDPASEGVFTGDSFGLAYPALQRGRVFIFPSTSPTDFDPEEARKTVQRIVETGARRVYLTHFGELGKVREAADQLLAHLDFCEGLLEEAVRSAEPDSGLDGFCQPRVRAFFERMADKSGLTLSGSEWEMLRLDVDLNAQGIAHVARKRRHPQKAPAAKA